MQNTSDSHLGAIRGYLRAQFSLAHLCMATIFLALVLLGIAITPGEALAKSYDMTKVDITAQAETNGSLHAVEQRIFDFNGSFSAVWWTFDGLPSNAQLKVNSMRIARVDDAGVVVGEWESLPDVAFVLDWRESGGPGANAYSVDAPKNAVYAFFSATDEKVVMELDYTVINGVQAYKDVAEVYWKYVGSQWEESSSNVSVTLALPVPQGVAVTPGNNVRAWGHGPLDGKVAVNADGSIAYSVPKVNAGQYAEARVVFPVSWLSNLSAESAKLHAGETRLEQVLSEEQVWADQANRNRVWSLVFIIGCGVICVALIAWALFSYMRFGKEYAPDFTDEYWRDVPQAGVHPVVIGRLWRWNRESQDDFSATLMYLCHKGAIRIDRGSYEVEKSFGRSETVEDYYLTKVPAVADTLTSDIERIAMQHLFDRIGGGKESLWFGTIQQYGNDHPEDFINMMKSWQGAVSAATNQQDYFELKGKRYQGYMIALAAVVVVAAIAIFIMLQNFIPLIFMIPTAIALGVIGNHMPRRSVEGNNVVAKCKALRNWLRDFSSLDERPPTDVLVWGEFMVYAYLFGIAKEVMKALQTKVPELFESQAATAYGYGYVPWWFWYGPTYGAGGSVIPSASDLLHTTLSNTVSTAQAALSGAQDNFSSGGGFGGGFSGGGGGGFGGGGGAR